MAKIIDLHQTWSALDSARLMRSRDAFGSVALAAGGIPSCRARVNTLRIKRWSRT